MKMIASFYAHEADFNLIYAMFSEDLQLEFIDFERFEESGESFDLGPGRFTTEQRIAEYRTLMRQLLITFIRKHNGEHWYSMFDGGDDDTSWSIGIAWTPKPRGRVVKAALTAHHRKRGAAYSHLKDDWYLYNMH